MINLLLGAYGIATYVFFLATFLYTVAFVGNLPAPHTVDVGPAAPVAQAVVIDALLLVLFAAQHSVMARASFKRVWTRVVPATIERSTYVLAATLALAALVGFWRPIA